LTRKYHPQIGYVDGNRFQWAIVAGCREIIGHEEELNRLNVFPIPDEDTGSNLKKTLIPLVAKFPILEPKIHLAGQEMAAVAVGEAMGYSGIIFSQFLHGFAQGLKNFPRIYPDGLHAIVAKAVEKAYQSVERPVEGTILSVMDEWAKEIARISSRERDFVPILELSEKKALSALSETPNQLPVLKKNKVVDAGGKAFVYFLEGMLNLIRHGRPEQVKSTEPFARSRPIPAKEDAAPQCVECCIRATDLDRRDLLKKLRELGQDLIFYGAPHFVKFHINTHFPDQVWACASSFGKISRKRIFSFSQTPSDGERHPFCLVADSTCDLTTDKIEQNHIYFVPIKVQVGENIYTDRLDIIPEEFYPIMERASSLPKTSQPSLKEFTRVFRHLLMHYDSIISTHVSKALSGTFQTAVQASLGLSPERISVIDGKNISVGLGLILEEGFKACLQGMSREKATQMIQNAAGHTQIFIGLPTLKYLVKGGRITKTKGIIAQILNINPILSIGPEGKLIPVSKARGKKKLETKIFDLVYRRKQNMPGEFSIAVAHTNAPEKGTRISEKIKKIFGLDEVLVMNASPVLGAHAGPGAFGVAVHNHSVTSSDSKRKA
jgi:DegV family protein with EDD domain